MPTFVFAAKKLRLGVLAQVIDCRFFKTVSGAAALPPRKGMIAVKPHANPVLAIADSISEFNCKGGRQWNCPRFVQIGMCDLDAWHHFGPIGSRITVEVNGLIKRLDIEFSTLDGLRFNQVGRQP